MDYVVRVNRQTCGDVVALIHVAEAMAKHESTGYGAYDLHMGTLHSVRNKYVTLLVDAAKRGVLIVRDCNGEGSSYQTLVDASVKAAHFDIEGVESSDILALFTKMGNLKAWGEANHDTFTFLDSPGQMSEFGPVGPTGEKAFRGFVGGGEPMYFRLKDKPAQTTTTGAGEGLDYSLLATPAALLDAFRQWGMKPAWFDDLNSRKWLLDARKKKGQGQRGHVIEPLFCPYLVMDGLLNKVRKVNRLQPDTAWRTLQHKFPKVYTAFESHDPRDRTGD